MAYGPKHYGEAVAELLALDGAGERLMPLVGGACSSQEARARLKRSTAAALFPGARAAQAAMAGLYLYFSCMDEAHEIAQGITSAEGSYWHAIVHRQEPDAWNSGYWFGRVGEHAVFPALRARAAEIGVSFGAKWEPLKFIEYCESARRLPGSEEERRALEVQRAEWQLLFDYCASAIAR